MLVKNAQESQLVNDKTKSALLRDNEECLLSEFLYLITINEQATNEGNKGVAVSPRNDAGVRVTNA